MGVLFAGNILVQSNGGPLPIVSGGTGQTTATDAINALLPSQTSNSGKILTTDGTDVSWTTASAGTVTNVSVSGGTTGLTTSGGPITTAGTITLAGTLAVANGGTGFTTTNSAFNNLAPSQTGNSGKFLTTDGTNTSWATVSAGSGTVTSVDVAVNNGITISGNPITTSGTLTFGLNNITPTTVSTTSVQVTNSGSNSINTLTKTTTTSTSQIAIATFDATLLGTAKYIIRIVQGSNLHSIEILVMTDGTNTYITQYASMISGSDLATFDIDISGSNCRLLATPASASSTVFYVNMTAL
jgi:hypothetical protein